MPVPVAYTETVLASTMLQWLDDLAGVLGWDIGAPQVQDAVAETLLDLGVSDISLVVTTQQIRGLRALGRRAIWRAVVEATSSKYDFADSDAKFTRSQMHTQALESYRLADTDCRAFDPNYAVSIVSLRRPQDPYIVLPDNERVLDTP